ncbi:TPA: phosphatase PAP2 family protein [Klebsiella pneumoniae]|nr:phosphatase PAP2 family protein [Klebsiella pneumoniae]
MKNRTVLKRIVLALCVLMTTVSSHTFARGGGDTGTYHTASQAINGSAYLPPPPQEGMPTFKEDISAYKEGYKLKGTPRWVQASLDSSLEMKNIAHVFSVPLGTTISPVTTPALYKLLSNIRKDVVDYATSEAKKHYQRQRPFVYFGHHTCQTPDEEVQLRHNGSYPSGHSAFGWSAALILTQLRPERATYILYRGYEFGQSRVICGAHWQSDVNAGRLVGAVEYAYLQAIPEFQTDLRKAENEIKQQQRGK